MGDRIGARPGRRALTLVPRWARAAGPRRLAGLLAAAGVALGGCAGTVHRLSRAQQARLLGQIASARRAAAGNDRAGARAALEQFLGYVGALRDRGTLTAAQASALTSQAQGALHVALVLLPAGASAATRTRATTLRGDAGSAAQTGSGAAQTGSGAAQSGSTAAPQGAVSAPAQKPPASQPARSQPPGAGTGQGPAPAKAPKGGPGQGHQPPGKARKPNGEGNDNQGADG